MSDDLKQLRESYREIEAPAHVATRVRAHVADTPRRSWAWLPVPATALAVFAALWFVPFLGQQTIVRDVPPAKPSLSTLASVKPAKPRTSAPGLSQLRSVSVPAMPPKPELKKPQSNALPEDEFTEERNHAHS